jgi:predicted dehydrogenase
MRRFYLSLLTAAVIFPHGLMNAQPQPADLRIGIIGLDTSHAEQFTMRLNDAANPNHILGGRVVAAFPQSSPDIEESKSRIDGYTKTLESKYGVKMVGSVSELCAVVDAVMVLSLDGRPHLDQVTQVLAFKKPIFLDKPVAASLKDVIEIYKLADESAVPLFSASAVRWWPGIIEVATQENAPPRSAISFGPSPKLPHHPDLFFYGIHPTEALFTVMGPGCLSVVRTTTSTASVVTGTWVGNRIGTLHALHDLPMDSTAYKVIRFGATGVFEQKTQGDYTPMLREIIKFFQTKEPPVSAAQTLEIYAFMEAAEESMRKNGDLVSLRDVLMKAACPEKWLPAKVSPEEGKSKGAKPAKSPTGGSK